MDGHPAESRIFDNTELSELIHALSLALESHSDWLWQVQRALTCHCAEEMPKDECGLTSWLAVSKNHTALKSRVDVSALITQHDAMHRSAAELRAWVGEVAVSAEVYDRFLMARKAFQAEALAVERALWGQTCLVDSLTGLRNRHGMLIELREEQQRAQRDRCACVLAMMDIDHFKRINDRHGHAVGDAVLREVTQLSARRLRPYDRIYRYGGEEFLICLPRTDVVRGHGIVERLREEIATRKVYVDGQAINVTVSFGLAPVDMRCAVEESILRADRALYVAKANGRNRVFAVPAAAAQR